MKRLLIIAVLLFLAACGDDVEVHENVDKDLATDTLQVLEIMERAVKDKEMPDGDNQAVIDDYLNKYEKYYDLASTEINQEIYSSMYARLQLLEEEVKLDSAKDRMEDFHTGIVSYIENGETPLQSLETSK